MFLKRSIGGKAKRDRIRNDSIREVAIQYLLRVRRKMTIIVWQCKKNGKNKDTEKGIRLEFKGKRPLG
jgi:hypothetical protein